MSVQTREDRFNEISVNLFDDALTIIGDANNFEKEVNPIYINMGKTAVMNLVAIVLDTSDIDLNSVCMIKGIFDSTYNYNEFYESTRIHNFIASGPLMRHFKDSARYQLREIFTIWTGLQAQYTEYEHQEIIELRNKHQKS